jgi:asparagine synthase (glutamine-hydrolysing)
VCGIAGFIQRSPDDGSLGAMLERIASRGPDGEGRSSLTAGDWQVALGHRRLAILDIAGGAQPMATADASVHITYNGELYNFRELRADLEKRGVSFRTRSDTEVLLLHIASRGTEGLADLDGMFGFAAWDPKRRTLLLARDRVGIKPLYYAPLPDGGVAFASELASLLQHRAIRRVLSPEGLRSYFFSDYAHPPTTLVRGVFKVPAGCFVEWRDGNLSEARAYWRLGSPEQLVRGRVSDLAEELWARFGRSVERQLVADVPVGVFLSGGLDSSCVATLAAQRYGRRLMTFNIASSDPRFDESAHARAVARAIGSEHVEETLGEDNLLEVVDVALGRLDEPLADPSYLPTFVLARLAAAHVKVVLGGDGGDELFAGYPTYRAHKYAQIWRHVPLRDGPLHRLVAGLKDRDGYQTLEWKAKRFLLRWDDDDRRRHFRWLSTLDLPDLQRAMVGSNGAIPATLAEDPRTTTDWLNDMLALDLRAYLPGSVLTKVDRASMAHGLEVRPPLLDNEMVEWAFSLPSSLKLRHGRSKFLLKSAAEGRLPRGIVHRPKRGLAVPLRAWLRGPLKHRTERALEPSPLWSSGLLDRKVFAEWAAMHAARMGDHSKALWALIVLDGWVRRERIEPG